MLVKNGRFYPIMTKGKIVQVLNVLRNNLSPALIVKLVILKARINWEQILHFPSCLSIALLVMHVSWFFISTDNF